MENVKRLIKPHGHIIKDRNLELIIGLLLFLGGSLLLYDAFNGRGKALPWPANKIAPW